MALPIVDLGEVIDFLKLRLEEGVDLATCIGQLEEKERDFNDDRKAQIEAESEPT